VQKTFAEQIRAIISNPGAYEPENIQSLINERLMPELPNIREALADRVADDALLAGIRPQIGKALNCSEVNTEIEKIIGALAYVYSNPRVLQSAIGQHGPRIFSPAEIARSVHDGPEFKTFYNNTLLPLRSAAEAAEKAGSAVENVSSLSHAPE